MGVDLTTLGLEDVAFPEIARLAQRLKIVVGRLAATAPRRDVVDM